MEETYTDYENMYMFSISISKNNSLNRDLKLGWTTILFRPRPPFRIGQLSGCQIICLTTERLINQKIKVK